MVTNCKTWQKLKLDMLSWHMLTKCCYDLSWLFFYYFLFINKLLNFWWNQEMFEDFVRGGDLHRHLSVNGLVRTSFQVVKTRVETKNQGRTQTRQQYRTVQHLTWLNLMLISFTSQEKFKNLCTLATSSLLAVRCDHVMLNRWGRRRFGSLIRAWRELLVPRKIADRF